MQQRSPYSYQQGQDVYRDKFRPEQGNSAPANIMFDRRVVRGNTHSLRQMQLAQQQQQQPPVRQKFSPARTQASPFFPGSSVEPVEGRKHIDIQTDRYLEEISDRVDEFTAETQTDPFLDRPTTPPFIPQKSGVDATTQVLAGELFDFDREVEPILGVLAGKTLEQALLEVLEEEEITNIRQHRADFEQRRVSELAETQRLEAEERRRFEEKERRKAQEVERVRMEELAKKKADSIRFASGYLEDLEASAFESLGDAGYFRDPVEFEIETQFMPWLMKESEKKIQTSGTSRLLVDDLITAALKKRMELK